MSIEEAFDEHHDRIISIPGVTGIGLGESAGRPAVVILVDRLTPEVRERLPRTLNGFPVVVEESGEIVPF
ncbi:MAG TPA: hypothetical protein VFR37_25030 [Longimicrobium sp.]|nr:hypothetical protein [Longimicrobium sp.]